MIKVNPLELKSEHWPPGTYLIKGTAIWWVGCQYQESTEAIYWQCICSSSSKQRSWSASPRVQPDDLLKQCKTSRRNRRSLPVLPFLLIFLSRIWHGISNSLCEPVPSQGQARRKPPTGEAHSPLSSAPLTSISTEAGTRSHQAQEPRL